MTESLFPIFQSQLGGMFEAAPDDPNFADFYLRTLDLTQFSGSLTHVVDYNGNPWSHKVYCNHIIHPPLFNAFRLLVERGLTGELKTYDGCWNPRPPKGGGMRWSTHAYGISMDFNAATNPYISPARVNAGAQLVTDFSMEFVRCFSESGFEWGGIWTKPIDAMHFQIAWTHDWRGSNNYLAPVAWEG